MATEAFTEFDGTNGTAANLTTEPIFFNRTGANGWFYSTSGKASGTAHITCTNDVTLTSVWQYNHATLISTRYYDLCVALPALPTSELIIAQIRSGGTNRAQVTVQPDGTVRIKNGTTAVDSTAAAFVEAGKYFRFKWGITGGTQELRLYKDDNANNLFGTPTDDVLTGNMTQGTWDQFRFGVLSGIAQDIQLDRFVVDDSTWPTAGGGGNVAPTANAGADQDSVIGGTLVTLNGTGSTDSDGTIASYAWTQVSGPAITLSSTTVASPTFTAPTSAGTATFGLRVTDNDGAQSTQDTVVITWSAASPSNPTSDFYELFNGADGVALTATPGNSGFDTVDSGWTFEVTAPPQGSSWAKASGNGAVKILTHNLSGLVSSIFADAIFQIDNLAVGPWYIMRIMDGSTIRGSVRVNTDGTIQCRNNITAVGTAAGSVVAGEPFRVAWNPVNGGTQTARLFTGANLFGTSPSATTSGTLNAGTFDRIGFGIGAPAVASGTIQVDVVQVDATTWPEPFGASTLTPSGLYLIEAGPTYTPVLFDLL